MLTSRDRWLALFAGKDPGKVLCDYWGTAEVTQRLQKELNCPTERALYERLGVDKLVMLGPTHLHATEDTWHTSSLWSLFHVEVTNISYGEGLGNYEEASGNPLAQAETAADVERFAWPDPALFDIEGLIAKMKAWEGYPIQGGCYEPFYFYCRLRGMEQAIYRFGHESRSGRGGAGTALLLS